MPVENPKPFSEGASWNSLAGGLVVLALLLVFVIWLGFSVQSDLDSLEDRIAGQTVVVLAGEDSPGVDIVEGQTVYVPVYSHVYADGGRRYPLETTLSVRNLDPERSVTITSVRYFDRDGALLREYLDEVKRLAPLATAEFLAGQQDVNGGSGANFIVSWDADGPVYEPLIEAVMVGLAGPTSISLTSAARVLVDRDAPVDAQP